MKKAFLQNNQTLETLNIMRKLNKQQQTKVINFIEHNKSAGMYVSVDTIDPSGSIQNLNWYETCWSDIERFYTDFCVGEKV